MLAAIGIYGTMSYTVAARTHEIGVRMALGATPFQVKAAELSDAGSVALAGIIVGLTVGFLASRFVESTLYGVARVDPTAYGGDRVRRGADRRVRSVASIQPGRSAPGASGRIVLDEKL
ncbi:MAG TPA: FtsX-like permease family protein [Gemmatimonadaceae bacterium]